MDKLIIPNGVISNHDNILQLKDKVTTLKFKISTLEDLFFSMNEHITTKLLTANKISINEETEFLGDLTNAPDTSFATIKYVKDKIIETGGFDPTETIEFKNRTQAFTTLAPASITKLYITSPEHELENNEVITKKYFDDHKDFDKNVTLELTNLTKSLKTSGPVEINGLTEIKGEETTTLLNVSGNIEAKKYNGIDIIGLNNQINTGENSLVNKISKNTDDISTLNTQINIGDTSLKNQIHQNTTNISALDTQINNGDESLVNKINKNTTNISTLNAQINDGEESLVNKIGKNAFNISANTNAISINSISISSNSADIATLKTNTTNTTSGELSTHKITIGDTTTSGELNITGKATVSNVDISNTNSIINHKYLVDYVDTKTLDLDNPLTINNTITSNYNNSQTTLNGGIINTNKIIEETETKSSVLNPGNLYLSSENDKSFDYRKYEYIDSSDHQVKPLYSCVSSIMNLTGDIYFGFDGQTYLLKYSNDKLLDINIESGKYNTGFCDLNNNVYMIKDNSNSLYKLNTITDTITTIPFNTSDAIAKCGCVDNNNVMYIGLKESNHILRYIINSESPVFENVEISNTDNTKVLCCAKDSNNNIYLGLESQKYFVKVNAMLDTSALNSYSYINFSETNETCNCMAIDANDNLYIGISNANYIYHYNINTSECEKISFADIVDNVSLNATTMAINSNNELYIGFNNQIGYILKYNINSRFSKIDFSSVLNSWVGKSATYCSSIVINKNDTIFISTQIDTNYLIIYNDYSHGQLNLNPNKIVLTDNINTTIITSSSINIDNGTVEQTLNNDKSIVNVGYYNAHVSIINTQITEINEQVNKNTEDITTLTETTNSLNTHLTNLSQNVDLRTNSATGEINTGTINISKASVLSTNGTSETSLVNKGYIDNKISNDITEAINNIPSQALDTTKPLTITNTITGNTIVSKGDLQILDSLGNLLERTVLINSDDFTTQIFKNKTIVSNNIITIKSVDKESLKYTPATNTLDILDTKFNINGILNISNATTETKLVLSNDSISSTDGTNTSLMTPTGITTTGELSSNSLNINNNTVKITNTGDITSNSLTTKTITTDTITVTQSNGNTIDKTLITPSAIQTNEIKSSLINSIDATNTPSDLSIQLDETKSLVLTDGTTTSLNLTPKTGTIKLLEPNNISIVDSDNIGTVKISNTDISSSNMYIGNYTPGYEQYKELTGRLFNTLYYKGDYAYYVSSRRETEVIYYDIYKCNIITNDEPILIASINNIIMSLMLDSNDNIYIGYRTKPEFGIITNGVLTDHQFESDIISGYTSYIILKMIIHDNILYIIIKRNNDDTETSDMILYQYNISTGSHQILINSTDHILFDACTDMYIGDNNIIYLSCYSNAYITYDINSNTYLEHTFTDNNSYITEIFYANNNVYLADNSNDQLIEISESETKYLNMSFRDGIIQMTYCNNILYIKDEYDYCIYAIQNMKVVNKLNLPRNTYNDTIYIDNYSDGSHVIIIHGSSEGGNPDPNVQPMAVNVNYNYYYIYSAEISNNCSIFTDNKITLFDYCRIADEIIKINKSITFTNNNTQYAEINATDGLLTNNIKSYNITIENDLKVPYDKILNICSSHAIKFKSDNNDNNWIENASYDNLTNNFTVTNQESGIYEANTLTVTGNITSIDNITSLREITAEKLLLPTDDNHLYYGPNPKLNKMTYGSLPFNSIAQDTLNNTNTYYISIGNESESYILQYNSVGNILKKIVENKGVCYAMCPHKRNNYYAMIMVCGALIDNGDSEHTTTLIESDNYIYWSTNSNSYAEYPLGHGIKYSKAIFSNTTNDCLYILSYLYDENTRKYISVLGLHYGVINSNIYTMFDSSNGVPTDIIAMCKKSDNEAYILCESQKIYVATFTSSPPNVSISTEPIFNIGINYKFKSMCLYDNKLFLTESDYPYYKSTTATDILYYWIIGTPGLTSITLPFQMTMTNIKFYNNGGLLYIYDVNSATDANHYMEYDGTSIIRYEYPTTYIDGAYKNAFSAQQMIYIENKNCHFFGLTGNYNFGVIDKINELSTFNVSHLIIPKPLSNTGECRLSSDGIYLFIVNSSGQGCKIQITTGEITPYTP